MNIIVKRKNYTIITNEAVRDKRLSLKARGLLCFCMSLSDDWKYSVQGLASAAGAGVDTIKSAIKELEQVGYLVRKKYRDEHGRMACDYVISDQPVKAEQYEEQLTEKHVETEKPQREDHSGKTTVEKPQRENRSGSAMTVKPTLRNNNKEITKRNNKKEITRSSSSNNNIYNNARNDEPCVSSSAAGNAIAFWMNNTGQFGEVIRSDISDLTEQYGEAVVTEAMREAIRSNVRNIKYVTAIVERMASGKERTAKNEPVGNAWSAAFEKLYGGGVENGNNHGEECS